jgi:hypothetical protein
MKAERAGQILSGVLVSLARWEEELAGIQPAPGSEKAKFHMQASLAQSRASLKQLMERSEGRE